VFRVYTDTEGGFNDYDIHHYDLEVEIIADDSELFSDGEKYWIDYKE
jgi:hypothetical protein